MEIFRDFAKKIVTKEDLIFFLEEINLVQRLIFKNTNIPLSEKVKENRDEDFGKEDEEKKVPSFNFAFAQLIEELEKKKIISKNPEENRIFFENFKKYLQNLPQIKIEMAFRPKKEFVNKISLWLEKEIKQRAVLDLIFNPEIVGGAIIEYQGRQINFSLAKKIDELISQKQL